jgi:hypothetical protein
MTSERVTITWTKRTTGVLRLECFRCGRDIGPFEPYYLGERPDALTRACVECHAWSIDQSGAEP